METPLDPAAVREAADTASLLPHDDLKQRIRAEIDALSHADIHDLRLRWRKLFRSQAPAHLPRYLLFHIIAYRIQADAFGDLDRQSVRLLDRIANDYETRKASGTRRPPKAPPPVPPVPPVRGLKPGTILAREHDGVLHRVMVTDAGFAWNGSTYRSLSEAARAITGTNWNGPRFFGLRQRSGERQ